MSRETSDRIREYYNKWTRPASERGKSDEQKRLNNEFHDDKILLRFNVNLRQWQIWYNAPNGGLYCVTTVEEPFNIAKLIKELGGRQKSSREMLKLYQDQMVRNEKNISTKRRNVAEEMAKGLHNYAVGRITTGG